MVLLEDMIEAYYDCRRKKRNTASAVAFEVDYEVKLLGLVRRINDRSYTPGKSICFVVRYPRYREVFAAAFEDRIPHHYIYNRLNPLFENIFGDRIFNCRDNKGQLYGVKMLASDIKSCSENYTQDCFTVRLDIKAFFMSIGKKMLAEMVDAFIVENYVGDDKEDLRFLCRVVIMHNPEKNCILRSPSEFWKHLPKEKSLFTNGGGRGIAIGNLFAQLFANFLLWFLENVFKESDIAFHGRYVDDIYAIDKSKEKLLALVPKIRARLSELGLRLNEKKFYLQHYAKGIQFTGAIVKPGRIYPLRRNIRKFKESIRKLNQCRTADEVSQVLPAVNSYLGLLVHYNTYVIRKRELLKLDKRVFEFVYIKGHYESVAMKRKYTKRYEVIQRIKEEDKNYKIKNHRNHTTTTFDYHVKRKGEG